MIEQPPPDRLIAFLGTYPPRHCGIATFTLELAEAMSASPSQAPPMIVAVTDPEGEHAYPSEVKYEIRQGARGDYARAAELVRYSDVGFVSIQHEHGIFGGDDGAYVLDFLQALQVPAIASLHTVLKRPSASQRAIVQRLAADCAGLVVMSRVARDLLASAYGVSGTKVHVIPHGIPELEQRDQDQLKTKLGVGGRRVLLSFGLLSRNKGIETVLQALPSVLAAFPDVVYFVVGATHPVVRRREGEAYRIALERLAESLGVREHVVFRDQYVPTAELDNYLQATDIFISPYLNEAQVTSGALTRAMGAGAAVVSTPYWHAQELLTDMSGCLFPFGNSDALSHSLKALFGSERELARVKTASLERSRSMLWPRVGRAHLELANDAIRATPRRAVRPRIPRASSLPELRLDHLLRMTDDTGIMQHATYSVPLRRTGYCVDDNARALVLALWTDRVSGSATTRGLVTTYLSYLQASQHEDGHFSNFMSYSRTAEPTPRSDDCIGRAVWALGATVQLASDEGCRLLAREMLERALGSVQDLGPRGTAQVVLGIANLLDAEPGAARSRAVLDCLAGKLVERFHEHATSDWRWFEPTLTYDNATIPLGLFSAYLVTGDRSSLRVARESLEFLESLCFGGDQLSLVGNAGWHPKGGEKSVADEQPIDAAAFVLAFRAAYLATRDRHYLRRMRESFAWFLGSNRLGLPLYDFATAGCRDGLGVCALNQNQGAESTICFLISLSKMLELAGEGLEHGDSAPEPLGS